LEVVLVLRLFSQRNLNELPNEKDKLPIVETSYLISSSMCNRGLAQYSFRSQFWPSSEVSHDGHSAKNLFLNEDRNSKERFLFLK
jgi:hypothetical protein